MDIPDLNFEGENTNFGVHRIYSYPARFVPQLPRYFIEKYNPDSVCDCFGGSGTTAVEAKLHGCHAIHMDIMPISFMLARVKTHEFDKQEFHYMSVPFHRALDNLLEGEIPPEWRSQLTFHDDPEYFFNVSVQQQIRAVSEIINKINVMEIQKDFLRLCAAQCLRRCSNADTKGFEWNKGKEPRSNQSYVYEVRNYVEHMMAEYLNFYDSNATFLNKKVPTIVDTKQEWTHDTFDLLVTSPPYGKLNVVNYPEIHKFSHLFFCKEEAPNEGWFIQTVPQLNMYFNRVVANLKQNGHAIVVVAPSSKDDWAEATINIMANSGLRLHQKTQRIVDPGRKYSARGITKEWVLDFVK